MKATIYSSTSTFKQCHASLQAHYKIGRSAALMRNSAGSASMVQELKQDQGYQQIYKECGRLYVNQRGVANPAGKDPHDNTEQATFDVDDLVRMAEESVASADPLVARDWSMHISMCLMCGRGDDARYRLLCELTEPKYRSCIGGFWRRAAVGGSRVIRVWWGAAGWTGWGVAAGMWVGSGQGGWGQQGRGGGAAKASRPVCEAWGRRQCRGLLQVHG